MSSRCRCATISPRRMTDTRSVNDMISRNLWVMKMMVLFLPPASEQHLQLMVRFRWLRHFFCIVGAGIPDAASLGDLREPESLMQADRLFAILVTGKTRRCSSRPVRPSLPQLRCAPSPRSLSPSAPSITLSSTESGGAGMSADGPCDAVADRLTQEPIGPARRRRRSRLCRLHKSHTESTSTSICRPRSRRRCRKYSAFDDQIDVVVCVNGANSYRCR